LFIYLILLRFLTLPLYPPPLEREGELCVREASPLFNTPFYLSPSKERGRKIKRGGSPSSIPRKVRQANRVKYLLNSLII